jgi:peptide/nickel transport system substrate-binding protein
MRFTFWSKEFEVFMRHLPRNPRIVTLFVAPLLLALVVACGGAAQTDEPTTGQPAAEQPAATAIAVATPVSAAPADTSSTAMEQPTGTLTVGQKELGPFMGHPALTGNPQIFVLQTAPIGESILTVSSDLKPIAMLAKSWSVSEDGSTWTFNLNEGVQFHKGYGEMTAEDVIWSMRQFGAQGSKHPRGSNIRGIWENEDGHAKAIDDYTVEVNSGEPWSEVPINEILTSPGGSGTWIISKKQTDELGAEEANGQIAATGPWDLVEFRTGEFWRMEAVQDHWRKTPHFAELIFREIPEESSRIAGFQTGNLDTTLIAFDSLPLIREVEGAEIMQLPGGGESALTFYGQYYVGIGTENQQPGYDPDLPWVAADPDITSAEWEQAAKVRNALSIAIDRQGIVDTLLHGYGTPAVLWDFGMYEDSWLSPEMRWEYNPDRARQLLAEAGYPDGFSITLTPALRGAPVEVEACEAIATMWADIGVDVAFKRVPFSALRPSLIARNYQGSTCHAGGIRLEPGQGFSGMLSELNHSAVWNRGVEHPWLDEKVSEHMAEVNAAKRRALGIEIATFMFDNAITGVGLYNFDVVWPVGPRIQPWPEGVRYRDLRNINGYEFIRPR